MENIYNQIAEYQVPVMAYNKSHLASLYANNASCSISHKQLLILFKTSRKPNGQTLYDALSEIGYNKRRNYFTLKEVDLIFEFLGEPWLTEANKKMLIDLEYLSNKDFEYAENLRYLK